MSIQSHFPPLIDSLRNAVCYPHPVWDVKVLETHISWVILTGEIAYKIKKPVDFGFLNFSTLDRRHHCCEQELRLNRRLAPSLYVDVVPIIGTSERPRVGGKGEAIEYAVKMWQFDVEKSADQLAKRGELTPELIDRLAKTIARFHGDIALADSNSRYGGAMMAKSAVDENLSVVFGLCSDEAELNRVNSLQAWMNATWQSLNCLLDQRKVEGFVRECHGDLHLANLAEWRGELLAFDCIEFNEDFRWVDVQSEIAFLVMDLEEHGLSVLAWRFLNAYLAETGDYAGLTLLRYFLIYRATVRAKIALLTRAQTEEPVQAAGLYRKFRQYLDYCQRTTFSAKPILIITMGLSGSGKSTLALKLAERLPAVRLRSDVERKRLSATGSLDLYGTEMTRLTYQHLRDVAGDVLKAGFSVIVDATYLQQKRRKQMAILAAGLGVGFVILQLEASTDVLRTRITDRNQQGSDISDADAYVLDQQRQTMEEMDEEERGLSVTVNTEEPADLDRIVALCVRTADLTATSS